MAMQLSMPCVVLTQMFTANYSCFLFLSSKQAKKLSVIIPSHVALNQDAYISFVNMCKIQLYLCLLLQQSHKPHSCSSGESTHQILVLGSSYNWV